jgi:hypothetical protein
MKTQERIGSNPHGLTAKGRTNGLPVRLKPLKAGLDLLAKKPERYARESESRRRPKRGPKEETGTAKWTSPGSTETVDNNVERGSGVERQPRQTRRGNL